MNYSRDEVRRQLRASRADQAAALGPWRDALARLFAADRRSSGGPGTSAAAKAHLLGVPSRRGFLKIGGATVLGAAVLAACSDDGETDVAESGLPADATTTTADPADVEFDLDLLRTATSLEILAVSTYQTAIDSGLVTNPDVAQAAVLFRDQHDDHAGALQQATTDAGGTPFEEANTFLQDNVVTPALDGLTDEDSVVRLALDLETAAAETYAWAAGELSTTTLRQAIMGIGGVEARHQAVLRGFLDEDQVPVAFLPVDDRVPEEAFVGADGGSGAGADGGDAGGDTTTTTAGGSSTTTTAGGGSTTTTVGGSTTTTAG
ncbi:MAG: ferritin-like domain-containing protein [Acidimicrobiales bacterium]|nr:ferritin-like domain-containing protein [Acidimicrobiales bacterium]MCB9373290.1 ferritin-like domain-containing protein [Microthrixaceae bacterium]